MSLSIDLRQLIIRLHSEGKSLREIGKIVKKSFSTVRNIVNKYGKHRRIKDFPRSGRPKKLSEVQVKGISREVRKDPASSAVQIAERISKDTGNSVSGRTVCRALNSCGLHGRVPRKKPFISSTNRKKRMAFAESHRFSSCHFWNGTIFSDESKFEIFGGRRKNKIWRSKNSELLPQNLVPTVKHGGGSVMVWGCMSAAGVGKLVFVESTMRKEDYLKILKQNLKESVKILGLGVPWTFQQDNDPKHTAIIVKNWLNKNVPNQLNSPPQSPDINPIEHLWEHLDRQIRKRNITSKDHLKKCLLEEWSKIPTNVTQNLVDSMPRRMEAVIKAEGGPTKY